MSRHATPCPDPNLLTCIQLTRREIVQRREAKNRRTVGALIWSIVIVSVGVALCKF